MADPEQFPIPEEVLDKLLSNLGGSELYPQITVLPDVLEDYFDEFEELVNNFVSRLQKLYEPAMLEINRYYELVQHIVGQATTPDFLSGEELQLFWDTPKQREWLTDDIHERVLDPAIREKVEGFFELLLTAEALGLIAPGDEDVLLHNRTE